MGLQPSVWRRQHIVSRRGGASALSATLGSIQAAINPTETDNLFFVSDASGKKYFSKSGNGHENNIAMVQEINKGYRK